MNDGELKPFPVENGKVCQNRSVPTMKRLIRSGSVDQLLIDTLKTRESS